jgi:hypothetical protein
VAWLEACANLRDGAEEPGQVSMLLRQRDINKLDTMALLLVRKPHTALEALFGDRETEAGFFDAHFILVEAGLPLPDWTPLPAPNRWADPVLQAIQLEELRLWWLLGGHPLGS